MKTFFSIVLMLSSFLCSALLVCLLTIFNPAFLSAQMESSDSASEWAKTITSSVVRQFPVRVSDSDQKKLQESLTPFTRDLEEKLTDCLYHPGQIEREKSEIVSKIDQSIKQSVISAGLPYTGEMETTVHSYVNTKVNDLVSSSQVSKVEEMAQKINQYKTPSQVCCILFGILTLISFGILLAGKSYGAGIAFLISAILLTVSSFIALKYPLASSYDFMQTYQKSLSSSFLVAAGGNLLLSAISFLIALLIRKKSGSR